MNNAEFGLICDKPKAEEKERFRVEVSDARVSLQASHKQYCTAKGDPTQVISCNKDQRTNNELFEKKDNEDGTISLLCTTNRKYVSVSEKDRTLQCVGDKIGDKEKFRVGVIDGDKTGQETTTEEKTPTQVKKAKL